MKKYTWRTEKNELDQEEFEIVEAFNSGKLESVSSLSDELKNHKIYASATLKVSKINRIPTWKGVQHKKVVLF